MSADALRPTVRTGTLAGRPAATAVAAGDAYLATDTGQLAVSDGVTWQASAPRRRDVQAFTGSGSWVPPPGALADPLATVRVIEVGPGQGGASGPRRAAGVASSGGGGGAAGAVTDITLPIADMTSGGPIAVTIPAGGVGGAAVTTDDTNGNAGGVPSANTNVAAISGGIRAYRSGAAPTGGSTAASAGGAAPAATTWATSPGAGCAVGAAGQNTNWMAGKAPSSGAAGGGITAINEFRAGGTSGGSNETETGTAAGGGSNGAAGGAGWSAIGSRLWTGHRAGTGGGGGASGVGVPGGNGGAGGNWGGGGGGGGASQNGFNSGAGGAGASGFAIIITEWGG